MKIVDIKFLNREGGQENAKNKVVSWRDAIGNVDLFFDRTENMRLWILH